MPMNSNEPNSAEGDAEDHTRLNTHLTAASPLHAPTEIRSMGHEAKERGEKQRAAVTSTTT